MDVNGNFTAVGWLSTKEKNQKTVLDFEKMLQQAFNDEEVTYAQPDDNSAAVFVIQDNIFKCTIHKVAHK